MNSGIKIIFIAGMTRSGSTVLDLLLGQRYPVFSLGETRHIWSRGFTFNTRCGCGKRFRECEFWQAVVHEAFGGFDKIDADYLDKCLYQVTRFRNVMKLLYPSMADRAFRTIYAVLKDHVRRLYEAIGRVSGLNVLVDSSKWPLYALFLSNLGFDVCVIHLVRDSRAVVYSWKYRKKIDPSFDDSYYMANIASVSRISLRWVQSNLLSHAIGKLSRIGAYSFLKYEDFVINGDALQFALNRIGLRLQEKGEPNQENHTVAGNPVRFGRELEVSPDTEYRRFIPARDFLLATAYTWPLLLMYRYKLRK